MAHIDNRLIYRAVINTISEEEEMAIDAHAGGCADCLERLRTALVLYDNFEKLFDSWNAGHHGAIFRRWIFCEAMSNAGEQERTVLAKVLQSVNWLKEQSTIGISIIFDRGRNLVSQAASLLPVDFSFELQPVFAGVGNAQSELIDNHRRQSSTLLSQGDIAGALDELQQAGKLDRRSVEGASSTLHSDRDGTIRVYGDSLSGRVWIKYWPVVNSGEIHYVLLSFPDSPSESRIAILESVQGEDFQYAVFDNVNGLLYELYIGKHSEDFQKKEL